MDAARREPGLMTLAIPMAIWALHFVVIYSFLGLACERGWHHAVPGALDWITWVLIALALAALAALGVISLRVVRDARSDATAPVARRRRFLSRATLVLGVLASIAVVYTTIPAFLLPSCQ